MSTRSHIVKKLENGKYIGIYHHSDGYPEYLGKLLVQHYDTEEKLDKLIALGDISFAGPIPEDDPELWNQHIIDFTTLKYNYESDKCKTYKGRGDEGCDARVGNLEDFTTEDFTYIFKDGHWYFYNWTDYVGPVVDYLCGLISLDEE